MLNSNMKVAGVRPTGRTEKDGRDETAKRIQEVPGVGAELPETMTVDEAARFLGINRNTLYEDIKDGRFPAGKFGRRGIIRISRDAVIRSLTGSGTTSNAGGGR